MKEEKKMALNRKIAYIDLSTREIKIDPFLSK